MLQWVRKYSKSWFIFLAIGAIVVVFIFWGVGGFKSGRFQEVAEVNGTPILLTAFLQQYNFLLKQYQERTRGEMTPELIKTLRLKEMALTHLMEKVLLLQAAERLGLQVSDAELRQRISRYPVFQERGRFSEKRYSWVLSRSHLTPAEFEAQERQSLLIQKVVQAVTSFAKVSDGELQEFYRMGKEMVEVNYLEVSPDKFLARQNPSEAEVARYYQENQAEFRLPTRVRVIYLLFRPQDFGDKVKVFPAEVENYLKEHEAEFFRPKVIRARQLVLPMAPKATPGQRQQVEKQARDLLAQTRAGEDFSQLAKKFSQDKATAEKGGDLGDVKRGEHPPEWDQVAFSLKPGDVGLASTPKAFFLIKVDEIKDTEKLPGAQERVTKILREEQSRRLARETAQTARGELTELSFLEVAKKYRLTPTETPLFALQDSVPGLGKHPSFNEAAMQLKPKEISRVVGMPGGFAILQGVERQPEHIPPLLQIKDRVRKTLRRQRAKKQAEGEAVRLLALLKKGEPLARVASQAGLSVKDSGFFTRSPGFLKQPQAESLTSAAFQLSSKNPYPPQPLLWKDNYYLLAFKARRLPDPEEFHKERDKLAKSFLDFKRQLLFSAWLNGERQRAKIQIYELPS